MAKTKTKFVCQECGYESMKWMGRCPGCQNWNTLVEELETPKKNLDQPLRWRDCLAQSRSQKSLQK